MTNKFTLENAIKDAKIAAGTFLAVTLLWASVGLPLHLQNKNHEKITAAYKRVLANYKPNHTIRMGDEVNGEVIDTVRETANLMQVYVDINGKQTPVPLGIKTEYLARHNGIPTEGKNGYNVGPETVLEY